MRQRRLMIILMTMLLLVAACSGGDSVLGANDDTAVGEPDTGSEAPGAAPEQRGPIEGETVSFQSPSDRKVIHRAALTIEADETRSVYERVQRLVDEAGGFVESANIADATNDEDQPRITMVIRIPADELTTALKTISGLATRVVSQSQQGQDVTEEYVDVEARITNLTALETELRALLAEVREQPDADPTKLLQVFNEISRVRGEIEQLEGRRQVLDDLTSLATVELGIAPTPAVAPVVAEDWQPLTVARAALGDLVGALQRAGDLGIRFVVYLLPISLIVLGIPGFIIWRLRRRFGATGATTIEA